MKNITIVFLFFLFSCSSPNKPNNDVDTNTLIGEWVMIHHEQYLINIYSKRDSVLISSNYPIENFKASLTKQIIKNATSKSNSTKFEIHRILDNKPEFGTIAATGYYLEYFLDKDHLIFNDSEYKRK